MMSNILGISSKTLRIFLSGEYMIRLGNTTYKLVYLFLEKLRILEKMDKSDHRLKNENDVIIMMLTVPKISSNA
jgi:hypothetical protein